MNDKTSMRERILAAGVAALCVFLAGCPQPADPGTEVPSADDVPGTFTAAKAVAFDTGGFVFLSELIEPQNDLDIYDLGPMSPGDRLIIDVNGEASLDATVAVFDADNRLFRENDDEDLAANKLDPLIDETVRRSSDRFYLGITSSPFGPSTGDYTINVQVIRAGNTAKAIVPAAAPLPEVLEGPKTAADNAERAVMTMLKQEALHKAMTEMEGGPTRCGTCLHGGATYVSKSLSAAKAGVAPVPQRILLDFDGATVDIPGDQVYHLPAFDAGDINSAYNGETEDVKQVIVDIFKARMGAFGVETYTTDDAVQPTAPFTRIVFGGLNPAIFGIAQDIDPYNAVADDEAIVFTETFRPSVFGQLLTVDELGTAIGQVAAHEAGHTLGLYHVADVTAIMDTVGGPLTLLPPQTFKNTFLDDTVFPVGLQDSVLLLNETVGAAP